MDFFKITENPMVIKYKPNGSEINFFGLDDAEKSKSTNATGYWFEEITDIDENDFSTLDFGLRKLGMYLQIIMTFNPIDENHWIKRVFFDSGDENIYRLHSTYKDNFFLPEDYEKILVEKYKHDKNQYRINVLGLWGRMETGQEFYAGFNFDKHVGEVIRKDVPLHFTFDFNVVPYLAVSCWQVWEENNIYHVECLKEFPYKNPWNRTEEVCMDLREEYKEEGLFYVYGDATGRARRTDSNEDNWRIIERMLSTHLSNYSIRVPKSNPLVRKRRNFIHKLMKDGYNIRLKIDPSCKMVISDLQGTLEDEQGRKYKEKKRDPISGIVSEILGHFGDGMDYMLCEMFKHYYDTME
jgi:signal peptidase I